jgi:hypothetical protein
MVNLDDLPKHPKDTKPYHQLLKDVALTGASETDLSTVTVGHDATIYPAAYSSPDLRLLSDPPRITSLAYRMLAGKYHNPDQGIWREML